MSSVLHLHAPASTLEGELHDVLANLRLDARQSAALAGRLGFDGGGIRTLQAAADPGGYSRERVRQLEERARAHVRSRRWRLPILDRALEIVEASAPETAEHVAALLWERGLASEPFDPSGVVAAAELLGRGTSARLVDGVVVRGGVADPRRALVRRARVAATQRGAANVVEIALAAGLDVGRTRRLLALVPDVEWLDERRTWVSLSVPSTAKRATTILQKLLAVAPRLALAEVDEGMRRSFKPVDLPTAVLRNVIDSLDWAEREQNVVSSRVPLDPQQVLSPVEQTLVAVLGRVPGPLAYGQIVAGCSLNRNTVASYLRHSPVLKAVARGRYGLRGRES